MEDIVIVFFCSFSMTIHIHTDSSSCRTKSAPNSQKIPYFINSQTIHLRTGPPPDSFLHLKSFISQPSFVFLTIIVANAMSKFTATQMTHYYISTIYTNHSMNFNWRKVRLSKSSIEPPPSNKSLPF